MSGDKTELRAITYIDDQEQTFTAFIAMTPQEFDAYQLRNDKSIEPYRDRIISVVEGPASEVERQMAMDAFRHRSGYGPVAKTHG